MRKRKYFTKEQILTAMRHSKSIKGAARYLGCDYVTLIPYLKIFKDDKTGKTLHEIHKNQSGKGVPKRLQKNELALLDIIGKKIDPSLIISFEKIKNVLIKENYLVDECYKCGFNERRVIDYKVPLLLNFIDSDKTNYQLDNLELLCYNCYFLNIGDVFEKNEENKVYDINDNRKQESSTFEIDKDTLENMKALGII